MAEEIVGRGNNIKCYDKLKFFNLATGQKMHVCHFAASLPDSQALSCHRTPDDSDWFVALKGEEPTSAYHFKYGDILHLCHSASQKYLYVSTEQESSVSKKMECSVRDPNSKKYEHQNWIVEVAEDSQDEFWRVGEVFTIRNKQSKAYLCSHRKRIKQNDEYQVFGQPLRHESSRQSAKLKKGQNKEKYKLPEEYLWRVIETIPFIYTPPIVAKKKPRENVQDEELKRLTKVKNQISSRRVSPKKGNETEEILKLENRRLQQVEEETKKVEQQSKKVSCWRRYFCCICLDNGDYSKLD